MEPPETIDVGELVLRRWQAEWAGAATTAVRESLPELTPYLPWAQDSYDIESSQGFIAMSIDKWAEGTEFNYAIFTRGPASPPVSPADTDPAAGDAASSSGDASNRPGPSGDAGPPDAAASTDSAGPSDAAASSNAAGLSDAAASAGLSDAAGSSDADGSSGGAASTDSAGPFDSAASAGLSDAAGPSDADGSSGGADLDTSNRIGPSGSVSSPDGTGHTGRADPAPGEPAASGDRLGDLVGAIGLMTRMGPGVLEIGYWMRTRYAGRGYMTAAVEALARAALTLPGIDRVAIRHDVTNAASAAVAAKAGFVEVARVDREPEAPGESGTDVIRERRRALIR